MTFNLINYGFSNVRPVLASNILTLEGVFTLFLAIIFYREFPAIKELSGGLIIIISVILMNNLSKKSTAKIIPGDEVGS